MKETKGAVLPFGEIKVIKEEIKKDIRNSRFGAIKAFHEAQIGQTVALIISGNYLFGMYTVRLFEKISDSHAKVLGTEIRG